MKKIIAQLFSKIKFKTFNATATASLAAQRNSSDAAEGGDSILFHHWQRPGEVRVITI